MKICAFDTESTGLTGIMGKMLCASFSPLYSDEQGLRIGKPYSIRWDNFKHRSLHDDRALVKAIRDELNNYNLVVTWYGKQHDVPLLNARLAKWGEGLYHPQFHLDLCYYAGGVSMKIGSRKLINVQKYFKVPSKKTELDWDVWALAGAGDKNALNEVVEHCEVDTKVLAEIYQRMIGVVRNIHK